MLTENCFRALNCKYVTEAESSGFAFVQCQECCWMHHNITGNKDFQKTDSLTKPDSLDIPDDYLTATLEDSLLSSKRKRKQKLLEKDYLDPDTVIKNDEPRCDEILSEVIHYWKIEI